MCLEPRAWVGVYKQRKKPRLEKNYLVSDRISIRCQGTAARCRMTMARAARHDKSLDAWYGLSTGHIFPSYTSSTSLLHIYYIKRLAYFIITVEV